MTIFAITAHNGIRIAEVGEALGAVGGAALLLGGMTPFGRRAGMILGGLCIAAGCVLLIVATRWGAFG
jgi:hypothetical protein